MDGEFVSYRSMRRWNSHNAMYELKAQRKVVVGIQQQLHKNAVVITNVHPS